jgi:hypothetical protein
MEQIKITRDMKFELWDLMTQVDLDHEFTLRDLLHACVNAEVPVEILGELCQCRYIKQYYDEAESQPFDDVDRDLEYLELYFWGSKRRKHWEDGSPVFEDSHSWGFHGVGKAGVIPEDVRKWSSEEEVQKMIDEGWRQNYAVEFSPMHRLADYVIKVKKELFIEDDDSKEFKSETVDFRPSLTLLEVLYWVFWELSFCGSPEQRDGKSAELDKAVKELEEARKNGTIDQITTPIENLDGYLDRLKGKDEEA